MDVEQLLLKICEICFVYSVTPLRNIVKNLTGKKLGRGQWCGSVGRTVASKYHSPKVRIQLSAKFYNEHTYLLPFEKMKIKKKEAGNGPFKKTRSRRNSEKGGSH